MTSDVPGHAGAGPRPLPDTAGPTARGRPWTVRVATWSARHRWPVFGLWFVVTIGLFAGSIAAGGIRTLSATGSNGGTTTEAGRGYAAMSAGGSAAPSETMTIVVSSTSARVADPAFRSTVEAVVTRLASLSAIVGGTSGPAFARVVDPYQAPPQAGLLAPDRAAAMVTGQIDGDAAAREARTRAIEPALASLAAEHPGFEIHAIANTLTNDQINKIVNGDLDGALRISLPATFLILIVAFGAIVAAFVPLLLAVTALLAAFGLLGLYSQAFSAVSPYATQLVVLIGLAVAVDYSLFMITRFRSERRAGRDRMTAIETASATAGRSVFFSGVAVMISLGGLFLLPDAIFHSMALGTIAVILASIAGSLIFLPATLAILGDGVNRLSVPVLSRDHGDAHPAWRSAVGAITRRPWISAIVATALLLALASPVRLLRLGESDLTTFPDSVDGVKALLALQAHWPQGTLETLDVVATDAAAPATRAALAEVAAELPSIPGLSGPVKPGTSSDGSAAWVTVVMSGGQNDPANWDIVRRVRADLVPAAFATAPPVAHAYVTGNAAASLDGTQVYIDGMGRVFVFVLGLSFLLLMLVFHSIVIPIKAILLNLLSTGAAYGAVVLVFQEGWFGSALGVRPTEAIQNWVPVFVFTVLFGLSMDYEVFILSRVKEFVDRGLETRDAVVRGITVTAGTVTSAAAIMVVVFAVFLTLRLVIIRELGLGLAVAVFVDATIIRSVLLPATMRLLGEWNWYLPRFLHWLPRITIEGEPVGESGAVGAGQ